MANGSDLDIIENGYKITFFETPEKAHLSNNKSSLKKNFIVDSIWGMLKISTIKEVKASPEVINPLSFFENSGKKRLFFSDLRYINEHLY